MKCHKFVAMVGAKDVKITIFKLLKDVPSLICWTARAKPPKKRAKRGLKSNESDGDVYIGKRSSTRGLLDKASVRPHYKYLPPTQPQHNDAWILPLVNSSQ